MLVLITALTFIVQVTQARQQVSDLMGMEGDLQMVLASSIDSGVSTRCLAAPQAVES